MNVLSHDRQVALISCLIEGNSIRSTERLLDVNRNTIMRWGILVGEACERLHDQTMHDLHVNVLEFDELWSFIRKKQGHLLPSDSPEFGDCYTYLALDATKKAIVSYRVGHRDGHNTDEFAADVRARIVNAPQISTDGYRPYIEAIEKAFGMECDYAQVIKQYSGAPAPMPLSRRYSPPRVSSMERIIVTGAPDPARISTSFIERQNLNVRMCNRRFTRLTNAFSKKWRNHAASVALGVAAHNFVRVHGSLRVTPAMALGVTDHVWSVGELLDRALTTEQAPDAPIAPAPTERPRFTVLRGGRA